MQGCNTDSIEWFIEDQAFLRSYVSVPRASPSPLSRPQVVSLSQSFYVWPFELADGRGGVQGLGKEPRKQESLALYKLFNTLCWCSKFNIFTLRRQQQHDQWCRTFRPIQKKNSAAKEKKIGPPVIFPFERNLGLKPTIFVCVSGKTTLFLGHFPRIREDRRRKKRWNSAPFRPLFVRNRPKFGRRIVWPLHFLFGPFWLIRPIGNIVQCSPSHIVCWM